MSFSIPRVVSALLAAALWLPAPAAARQAAPAGSGLSIPTPNPDSPYLGGVSKGEPTGTPLPLSLADAIKRGLENNLGVLLRQQDVTAAHGERWESLSGLLPDVSARVGEARRKTSLAEFGFTEFPGITSRTIGPFNVFDTRLDITQPIVDISALYDAKAGAAGLRAAKLEVKDSRELVVLIVANLYLNAVAASARADAVRAELTTADALFQLATDLKQSGLAAGIDVLRAQVQQQTNRQRLILAENDVSKAHLQIARAIGLPPGQPITLVDRIPYAPLDRITLDQALARAYANRGDYLAAQAQLAAAEASHKSARASLLPRLSVTGEVGRVGVDTSTTDFIYGIAGSVTIPVFEGGRQQARIARTDAELRRRQATLADLRARIDLEVRSALLDVNAAQQALDAAKTGLELANQQLAQSRDRFGAGVAGNIEVVQSQEAVARATDSYIAALYAHNLSKAALARAAGVAEQAVLSYLGGVR
jgi:outer membrane protein TolC